MLMCEFCFPPGLVLLPVSVSDHNSAALVRQCFDNMLIISSSVIPVWYVLSLPTVAYFHHPTFTLQM